MKKKLIVTLIVLILLVGATFAYLFFNLNSVIERFKPQIENMASNIIGSDVTIGKIEAKVFPDAKLNLSQFQVGAAADQESFSLKELILQVKLAPLLSGKLDISKLDIVEPKIKIIKTPEGMKIPGVKMKAADSKDSANKQDNTSKAQVPFSLNLNAIKVEKASLELHDQVKAQTYSLNDLNVESKFSFENNKVQIGSYQVEGKALNSLPFKVQGRDLAVDVTSMNLNLPEMTLTVLNEIIKISASVDGKSLSGKANVSAPSITIENFVNEPAFSNFVPPAVKSLNVSGKTSSEIQANLDLVQPSAIGKISLQSIALSQGINKVKDVNGDISLKATLQSQQLASENLALSLNESPITIKFAVEQQNQQIKLNEIKISAFGGNVATTGSLDLGSSISFSTNSNISGINVASALTALKPDLGESPITGTLTKSNAQVSGKLGDTLMQSLSGNITFLLNNGSLKGFNIGGKVLKAVNNIPLLSGALYEMVPENKRQLISGADTDVQSATGTLTISNGTIFLKNIVLVSSAYTINADGKMGLDTTLDLNATISFTEDFSLAMTSSIKELKVLLDENKKITFPMTISGKPPAIIVVPNISKLLKSGTGKLLEDQAGKLLDRALGGDKGGETIRGLSDALGL